MIVSYCLFIFIFYIFRIFETQEKINLRWTENDDWSIHSTGPDGS